MGEYYRSDDDMEKLQRKETASTVTEQVSDKKDYDFIGDLLEDSETLVKGIVLSEILGKPKAKR
ncbi:MAG TPA: hypothetical protein P5064_01500 [Clostridia bacterium]|jgi:hypothetical protein|nr:hypothetical protein [Clostridiaceae bacterium]HOF27278.1 hypothetical protein [Clostridia bacterium]HOM34871.1 hypothetical protein [Clostridia bacterium]HOR90197.1 hypothetical protein [Clostridia bacterium]HOT70460.1 hypothetical protein [Clostridia bacterium]